VRITLEETHRRIAKEIVNILKLGARETALLELGSIHPDTWADFPHHKGKQNEIARNILVARKYYLENDDECFFRLGVAHHYIADSWTLRPRAYDKHTEWEESIEEMPILDYQKLRNEIQQMVMPKKEVELYLAHLEYIEKFFPSEIQRALAAGMNLISHDSSQITFEEKFALELMKILHFKLKERKEYIIKHFEIHQDSFAPVYDMKKYALRLQATFPPLTTISLLTYSPAEKTTVLMWCVPTQKSIGQWLLLHMKEIMKATKVTKGILISRGQLTPEAKTASIMEKIKVISASPEYFIASTVPFRLSKWSHPLIDLNFAYRICLDVARAVLAEKEKLQK